MLKLSSKNQNFFVSFFTPISNCAGKFVNQVGIFYKVFPLLYYTPLWQLKKLKSWGPFWSYQLNCKANSAHLAHFRGKWTGLTVLFSWYQSVQHGYRKPENPRKKPVKAGTGQDRFEILRLHVSRTRTEEVQKSYGFSRNFFSKPEDPKMSLQYPK